MSKLSIVIILYNEFELVQKCLDSIYKEQIPDLEIILVDNSPDKQGHLAVLERFPKIKYIQNKENIGFGKAVNIGAVRARNTYMLVLNPDTKLHQGTISYTLKYMDDHNDVGMLGCPMYSEDNILQQSAHIKYPSLVSHLYEYNIPLSRITKMIFPYFHPTLYKLDKHTHELDVKHGLGAYMLFRKKAFDQVKGFDDRFFLYREETDLEKRIIQNGWKIRLVTEKGGVSHFGGGGTQVKIVEASSHYLRSTYLFLRKYHNKLYVILAWFLALISVLISIIFLGMLWIIRKAQHKKTKANIFMKAWWEILIWHGKNAQWIVI